MLFVYAGFDNLFNAGFNDKMRPDFVLLSFVDTGHIFLSDRYCLTHKLDAKWPYRVWGTGIGSEMQRKGPFAVFPSLKLPIFSRLLSHAFASFPSFSLSSVAPNDN